jgi:adenylate kinase
MRIVLLGPPGAGKGTQAKRLAERLGIEHIATGDIFRRNARSGTSLGKVAKTYMEAGELVPDDVTVRLVAEALRAAPRGYVLDGFPRTVAQASALEDELTASGRPLPVALAFALDDADAVKRIAGRRTCARCQRSYNVEFDPPRTAEVCDVCGGELVQRADDAEQTVRRRIEVYHESTEPLLEFYGERGRLREIDASGSEEQVAERAAEALDELSSVGELK